MSKAIIETQSIGKIISTIHRKIYARLTNRLIDYEINTGQIHFLFTLFRNPGICQHDIAQAVNVDKATATKMLSGLEKTGYVKRLKKESDQRFRYLYLTKKGEDVLPKLKLVLEKHNLEIMKDFNKLEKNELHCLLEKLLKTIEG